MNVYDAQGRSIWLGEIIGRGGEASVYRVKGRSNLLAKIYEPSPRPNYPHKLAWMMSHPPQNPTRAQEHASLAWPVGLLYDARRRMVGYTMPYIQSAVPVLEVFNPRRRLERLPQFDRRYLHRAARNLAAALGALHHSGYVAGDINESNVLVTASAMVTLIDTDSFQVQEQRMNRSVVHYCPVGKLEYTPPELHGKSLERVLRLPEQDAFALAVLIFQLLMEGNHPFRAQWLGGGEPPPLEARIARGGFPYMASPPCPVKPPKNAPHLNLLHPEVSELFRRCFADGHRNPALRPGPELWERAIARAEKALILCDKGHYYSNHLSDCPRCLPKDANRSSRPAWTGRPTFSFRRQEPAGPSPAATPTPSAQPHQAAQPPPVGRPPSRPPAGRRVWTPGRPAFTQASLWNWARPKLYKSFALGGGLGALAGALPGAVVGAASWSAGDAAAWGLLWILGGVAGGMLRGWKPGYRLGLWVNQRIGWSRFWQAIGLVGGAAGGGMAGLLFGWAIFPVFVGLASGARVGLSTGRRIWLAGNQFGWERIWGGISAAGAALLGGLVAGWAGAGWFGGLADQFASSLASWLIAHSTNWSLVLAIVSALGGALGGAIAGIFADLFGRFSGLVD